MVLIRHRNNVFEIGILIENADAVLCKSRDFKRKRFAEI